LYSYCGRYGHSAEACFKKQADEARARYQKDTTQVQILKKEVVTPVEQKKNSERETSYVC